MTLILHLPPDLEQRLTQAAQQQGLPTEAYTIQLLDTHLPPREQRAALVALLQTWIDEADSTEQQETGAYLVRVLDKDRLSTRKLFPPDLEGVTW
ncbi:MAG TPA: hypothetical protein VGC99_12760 [Candidatus Tectomicrobia bacterium]